MTDETLMSEVRDQLADAGLDDDTIGEYLASMKDAGMFEVPEW